MESEAQPGLVPAAQPKRRWWQVSLTTLLVIVTVLGVTLGVFGRRAEQQRRAVAAIEAAGGWVMYNGDPNNRTLVQQLIHRMLPRDYLEHVEYVEFQGAPVTDETLAHVGTLTNVRRLYLARAHVTDAGLSKLRSLTRLEELQLDETTVTDAGLVHLRELTMMRWLSLNDTRVTDAGLTHLRAMHDLHWLYVEDTQVTDAGGVELAEFLPFCGVFNGDEWPDEARP